MEIVLKDFKKITEYFELIKEVRNVTEEVKDAYDNLNDGVVKYAKDTLYYTEVMEYHLNVKNIISIVMIIFFILVILLYGVFFWKKMREPMDFLSYILFVTIPAFMFITAFISIYFMITFDFCNSIHSSIYEGNFPIYNKGIGKLSNCFDRVK